LIQPDALPELILAPQLGSLAAEGNTVSFQWSQSVFTAQTVSRCDYVLTVENFQKLSDRLLGVGWSSLDVLGEQRLRIAHCMDDQFCVGHTDESGDVHGRFLCAGRLAPRSHRASIAAKWIGSTGLRQREENRSGTVASNGRGRLLSIVIAAATVIHEMTKLDRHGPRLF
jgi:hypothetical protein